MFTFLTFLAVLISVLPFGGVNLNQANHTEPNAEINWQTTKFPTPTGIINAVNKISDEDDTNLAPVNNKPTNPPGQTISQIAQDNHDGGISQEVHEVVPDNRFYPTPTLHPVPITTDTPTPTPGEISPSIYPMPTGQGGCPPCTQTNGKYYCIERMCDL